MSANFTKIVLFLCVSLSFSGSIFTWAQPLTYFKYPEAPFWQKKPALMERVRDKLEILVSVKNIGVAENLGKDSRQVSQRIKVNDKISPGPEAKKRSLLKQLRFQSIGQISLPRDKAFKAAKNFEVLTQVSDYIKKVVVNQEQRSLVIEALAYKYKAKMKMSYQFFESPEGLVKEIQFKITEGTFSGMRGTVQFLEAGPRKTYVQLLAIYNYNKIMIPQFFLEFGLEVVLQKTRNY